MSTSISKHNCKNITFDKYMPSNNNCIIFSIETGEHRERLEVTLFGLSDVKAAALVEALKTVSETGGGE